MATRRPLSARNVDYVPRAKKERYPFAILDRSSLVETLKHILKEAPLSPSVSVCEDDLARPTAEKIQQIYFACLNAAFNTPADALKQARFQTHHVEHPELQDDFIYRVQFFRMMKRFMEACLLNDFKIADLISPDARRTCRNLSAIINFMKFNYAYLESGNIREYQEACEQSSEELQRNQQKNRELRDRYAVIERQRCEEHELEQELKQKLNTQEQETQALKMQEESCQQHYQSVCEQKSRCEQRLAELNKELEKWSQRITDLKRQIVSSPDKLKMRLQQLQYEVEEVQRNSRQSETVLRMWESLASNAQIIPPVMRGLNEDNNLLTAKVEKKSQLQASSETIEEYISRQKQLLREATAKYQNLLRHLKLVEDESGQLAYDEERVPHFQAKDDLQRDVCLLQKEVSQKDVAETHLRQEVEEQAQVLQERKDKYEKSCSEIEDKMLALKAAYEERKLKLADILQRTTAVHD